MKSILKYPLLVLNGIKNLVQAIIAGFVKIATTIFNLIKNVIQFLVSGTIKIILAIFNGIKNLIKLLVNGTIKIIKFIINGIKNLVHAFFRKLKNPYHSSTLRWRGLIHSIAISALITVGFLILQPFSIKDLPVQEKNVLFSFIAGISILGMLICQFLLPFVFKSFYKEAKWTLGNQFFQSFLMILIITFGIVFYLSNTASINIKFPIDALIFVLLSLIPLFIFVVIQEIMHDNKFKKNANEMNRGMSNTQVLQSENPLKVLIFKGQNEKLSLIPNQLIYTKINKNESEFYFQNPFGLDKKMIAIDEIKVREELKNHPQFKAFHDDIIINVNAIQKVTGNARGYEIAIARVNELVSIPNRYKKVLEKL